MFLDLHQSGTQVTGTMTTLGHMYTLEGTMTGSHFELFASKTDKRPRVVGDVAGTELHLTRNKRADHSRSGRRLGDEYPAFEHIAPPALHDVPYNGLAKTPPMGWNSWNLFARQNRRQDRTRP